MPVLIYSTLTCAYLTIKRLQQHGKIGVFFFFRTSQKLIKCWGYFSPQNKLWTENVFILFNNIKYGASPNTQTRVILFSEWEVYASACDIKLLWLLLMLTRKIFAIWVTQVISNHFSHGTSREALDPFLFRRNECFNNSESNVQYPYKFQRFYCLQKH